MHEGADDSGKRAVGNISVTQPILKGICKKCPEYRHIFLGPDVQYPAGCTSFPGGPRHWLEASGKPAQSLDCTVEFAESAEKKLDFFPVVSALCAFRGALLAQRSGDVAA